LQPRGRWRAALCWSLHRGRAGRGGGQDVGTGDHTSAGIRLGYGHLAGGGASGGLRLGLGHLAGGGASGSSRRSHGRLAGGETSTGSRHDRLAGGRAGYSGGTGGGIMSGGCGGHGLGGSSGGCASIDTTLADGLDHRFGSMKERRQSLNKHT